MNGVAVVAVVLSAGLLSVVPQARADDCSTIANAMLASQRSPSGFRQYLTIGDGPERLASITLGSAVYMALGSGQWQTLQRAEVEERGRGAANAIDFSDCRITGEESVKGVPVTAYAYLTRLRGSKASPNRIWIGHDGLIRQQGVPGRGVMRYEYKDVKAPL